MFETLAEKQDARRAETVVLIAGKTGAAVDVTAAEGGLEIKWNDVATLRKRSGEEKPETEATLQITRDSFARHAAFAADFFAILNLFGFDERTSRKIVCAIDGAFVRTISVAREIKARSGFVESEVVREIEIEALKIVVRIGRSEELLVRSSVVEVQPIVPKDRTHAEGFAELEESGLRGETGSSGFVVKRANSGAGVAIAGTDVNKTPIRFAEKRNVPAREDGLNDICTSDDFAYAEVAAIESGSSRAETKVGDLIQ